MDMIKLDRDIKSQPRLFSLHRSKILSIPEKIISQTQGTNVIFTGIATSLSALKGAYYLLNMQKKNHVQLINTCDLLDYWYPQEEEDCPLVIVSRSGESAEIHRLLHTVTDKRNIIGVTECSNSILAKKSSCLLDFEAGEQAFPNTASFTISQLYALAIVVGLGYRTSVSFDELLGQLCHLSESVLGMEEQADEIGKMIAGSSGIIIEGQGYLTGIVEQYAQDYHETQTFGIPVVGGVMRHGAIELTEKEDVMTLLLIPDDHTAERKFALAEELWKNGKKVVILTDKNPMIDNQIPMLRLPKSPIEISSVLFTLGMQQIFSGFVKAKGLMDLQPSLVGKVTRRE